MEALERLSVEMEQKAQGLSESILQLGKDFRTALQQAMAPARREWEGERRQLEQLRRSAEEDRQRIALQFEGQRRFWERERQYFEECRRKWEQERMDLLERIVAPKPSAAAGDAVVAQDAPAPVCPDALKPPEDGHDSQGITARSPINRKRTRTFGRRSLTKRRHTTSNSQTTPKNHHQHQHLRHPGRTPGRMNDRDRRRLSFIHYNSQTGDKKPYTTRSSLMITSTPQHTQRRGGGALRGPLSGPQASSVNRRMSFMKPPTRCLSSVSTPGRRSRCKQLGRMSGAGGGDKALSSASSSSRLFKKKGHCPSVNQNACCDDDDDEEDAEKKMEKKNSMNGHEEGTALLHDSCPATPSCGNTFEAAPRPAEACAVRKGSLDGEEGSLDESVPVMGESLFEEHGYFKNGRENYLGAAAAPTIACLVGGEKSTDTSSPHIYDTDGLIPDEHPQHLLVEHHQQQLKPQQQLVEHQQPQEQLVGQKKEPHQQQLKPRAQQLVEHQKKDQHQHQELKPRAQQVVEKKQTPHTAGREEEKMKEFSEPWLCNDDNENSTSTPVRQRREKVDRQEEEGGILAIDKNEQTGRDRRSASRAPTPPPDHKPNAEKRKRRKIIDLSEEKETGGKEGKDEEENEEETGVLGETSRRSAGRDRSASREDRRGNDLEKNSIFNSLKSLPQKRDRAPDGGQGGSSSSCMKSLPQKREKVSAGEGIGSSSCMAKISCALRETMGVAIKKKNASAARAPKTITTKPKNNIKLRLEKLKADRDLSASRDLTPPSSPVSTHAPQTGVLVGVTTPIKNLSQMCGENSNAGREKASSSSSSARRKERAKDGARLRQEALVEVAKGNDQLVENANVEFSAPWLVAGTMWKTKAGEKKGSRQGATKQRSRKRSRQGGSGDRARDKTMSKDDEEEEEKEDENGSDGKKPTPSPKDPTKDGPPPLMNEEMDGLNIFHHKSGSAKGDAAPQETEKAYKVARGKKRLQQNAVPCEKCKKFNEATGMPQSDDACRHRFNAIPPGTPKGFWDLTIDEM